MHHRRCATMLHGGGPHDVLQRTRSSVHVETVVVQDFCGEQIVVCLLNIFVLAFLKCVCFVGGDSLPARGELGGAGGEILKICKPWEPRLRYEFLWHAHLRRHLIRAVRNATWIACARRDDAGPAATGFIFRGQCSQGFGYGFAECARRCTGSSSRDGGGSVGDRGNDVCRKRLSSFSRRVREIYNLSDLDLVGIRDLRVRLQQLREADTVTLRDLRQRIARLYFISHLRGSFVLADTAGWE